MANIGLALGGLAEGYQRQQEQQQRQLYQQFLIQQAQQQAARQAQALAQQQQALGTAWGASGQLGGGGMGGQPQPPQQQPMPQQQAPPQTAQMPQAPSGMSWGGAAAAAPLVRQAESGGNYNVGYGGADLSNAPKDATGFPQWAGKMGPQGISHAAGAYQFQPDTWKKYAGGLGVTDFSQGSQDKVFNAAYGAEGPKPWASNPKVMQALQPLISEAKQTSQQVTQAVPQQQWGRSSVEDLHRAIEQANPDASPQVKMLALLQLQKLMAPQEKMELQAMVQQHREVFQQEMLNQREKFQEGMTRQRESFQEQMAQQRQGSSTQRLGKPQFLELTGPDGTKKQVYVQERAPGDWVDAATGQKVDIPPGTDIGAVKAPGRQAAAQVNAMINAGNETAGALNNLVDLPISATAGWLMGVQAEKPQAMGEALKRSLASNMTPDDAKAVQVSFQGVARAMATLEAAGRATGLVGLTQQAQILMPQQGDSGLTVLRKYGEIRQLAERSIETIQSSPDVGQDQKKLMNGIVEQIKKSVPWTVKDVNALQRSPTDATVTQFAQRVHAEGASEGQGSYSVGQVIDKNGKKYRVTGGDPNDPEVEEVK